MNRIILIGILTGGCLMAPTNVHAKLEIFNAADRDVAVYLHAVQCTGARTQVLNECTASSQSSASDLVCYESIMASGDETEYKFEKETSDRELFASWCEGEAVVKVRMGDVDVGGDKSRCVVQKDVSTLAPHDLKLRCGYSKKAFKAMKKRTIL